MPPYKGAVQSELPKEQEGTMHATLILYSETAPEGVASCQPMAATRAP